VAKEVQSLVRKCGGYEALSAAGISQKQGLNAQLQSLRQLKEKRDREQLLADPEAAAMAKAYSANLRILKSDADRIDTLLRVKDYDGWASDPRNLDMANAFEGTKFAERRQAQLQNQYTKLGGDPVYQEWIEAHPVDQPPDAVLEQKVTLLKALKEFNRLGGEDAYLTRAAGPAPAQETLVRKLEMLKAILSAGE
jgi:hypothetical protein